MELTTKDKHTIAVCMFTTMKAVKHPECNKDVMETAHNLGIAEELEKVTARYNRFKEEINGVLDQLQDIISGENKPHDEDPLINAILKASKDQQNPDQN